MNTEKQINVELLKFKVMKGIFYQINGIRYLPSIFGGCGNIEPFFIAVPMKNLFWLKSVKFSFVAHIQKETYKGKAFVYSRQLSKIVKISGFAEDVQKFMENIGVDWSQNNGESIKDMFCPNIWHVKTKKNKELANKNPNCYKVYYKNSFGVLTTCFTSNSNLNNAPKWKNAKKIYMIRKQF